MPSKGLSGFSGPSASVRMASRTLGRVSCSSCSAAAEQLPAGLNSPNLSQPELIHDLPAGGRRLVQYASGYDATIVSGVVTRRNDVDTGARPGRLLRGRR